MTRYIAATEVARLLRADLKKAFPGVKFSVRTAHSTSLRVRWTDGPTRAQVDRISDRYASASFDSTQDITTYSDSTDPVTGERVHYMSHYVFTEREISEEFAQQVTDHVVLPLVMRGRAEEWSADALFYDLHTPWRPFPCGTGKQLVQHVASYLTPAVLSGWLTADTALDIDTYAAAHTALAAAYVATGESDPRVAAELVLAVLETQRANYAGSREGTFAAACVELLSEDPDSLPLDVLERIAKTAA